ncbi:MAG: MucB/RseB C-terminal domain-containing protein [Alcanivorax sp.]|nr:MucB/RseB C-terminal domain-containing protein [Alcanivorax sp.]
MLRTLALSLTLLSPLAAMADQSADTLLQNMAQASRSLDYQGRFLYQFGAEVSTMEVSHAVIDGREYQRLTHLDGSLVEVIRRGDEVLCLHPDRTLTRLENDEVGPFNLGDRLAHDVPEQYNVLVDGDSRVAGRAATVLRVAPLDTHRYGYRLWLDNDSHLMLKSETVDGSGVALERVEFVNLALAPSLKLKDFAVPESVREHALKQVPEQGLTRDIHVRAHWLPKGFAALQEDWRRSGDGRQPVAAQGYSDGLATFTVFVEPVGDGSVEEGVSRVGPTVAISRKLTAPSGGYLVTLVGEVPQATAERVVDSIHVQDGQH